MTISPSPSESVSLSVHWKVNSYSHCVFAFTAIEHCWLAHSKPRAALALARLTWGISWDTAGCTKTKRIPHCFRSAWETWCCPRPSCRGCLLRRESCRSCGRATTVTTKPLWTPRLSDYSQRRKRVQWRPTSPSERQSRQDWTDREGQKRTATRCCEIHGEDFKEWQVLC